MYIVNCKSGHSGAEQSAGTKSPKGRTKTSAHLGTTCRFVTIAPRQKYICQPSQILFAQIFQFPKICSFFLCGVDLCGVVNGSSGEKQSGDKSPDYPIFISHFQGNKTQNRYHKIIRKSKWGRVSRLSDLYFSFPRK